MPRTGTQKTGYVNRTELSDDFRTLLVPKVKAPPPKLVVNNCPICLNDFTDPRSLPCYHSYCRNCLQYTIDRSPPDPDQDRGFTCVQCGFFVKVVDYSMSRDKWADQITDDFTTKKEEEEVNDGSSSGESDTFTFIPEQKDRDITKDWHLDWQISAYSKSDFQKRGLDPYVRTEKGFRYVRGLKVTDGASDDDGEYEGDATDVSGSRALTARDINVGREHKDDMKDSQVTAVTNNNDEIIVFDKGLSEVLVYNPDLTLKTTLTSQSVFGLAVLDNILYMTNPNDLCIDVVDLQTMQPKPSINITMKCYGITSLGEELATLLWDVDDQDLHICFLDDCCVTGGYIPLMTGAYPFKNPRKLAGCPRTRLLYVSDSEAGLVKCFRPDGKLKWEKVVYDAGDITVFNCYAIVARRFTHSVDVLSERGGFVGRLQSEDYGLIAPSVLSANTDTTKLVISDQDHMLHLFKIKSVPQKQTAVKGTETASQCCAIL